MRPEFIALIILIVMYWYFIMRKGQYVTITMPPEKMSNVSIFDGDNLSH
uniref:Uncharacterized protein n=1 Tax=viral metagenome TaxID=1070528 RepID=A0A6C0DA32_9ZZZZ